MTKWERERGRGKVGQEGEGKRNILKERKGEGRRAGTIKGKEERKKGLGEKKINYKRIDLFSSFSLLLFFSLPLPLSYLQT